MTYVFVTVASTRFRATVQATGDGSQPLLTGAWESLSHRCRLPVQQDCTDARQELRSSQPSAQHSLTIRNRLTDYGVCAPYQVVRGCPVLQVINYYENR